MASNNNALWIGLGVFFGVVLVLAVAMAGGWYMFKPDIRTFSIYRSYQRRFGTKARESVSLDSSRRSSLAISHRSSLASGQRSSVASSRRSSSARVTLNTDDNTVQFVADKQQYDGKRLSLEAVDGDVYIPVSELSPQNSQIYNIDAARIAHAEQAQVNTILRNMKFNLNKAILEGK